VRSLQAQRKLLTLLHDAHAKRICRFPARPTSKKESSRNSACIPFIDGRKVLRCEVILSMPATRTNKRFGPYRVPTESGFYSKGCENFDDVEGSNVEDRRKVRSTVCASQLAPMSCSPHRYSISTIVSTSLPREKFIPKATSRYTGSARVSSGLSKS
jgi:hypothetical protein